MTNDPHLTDKELYVCLKCYHVGPLDDALHCTACQSDVVASKASLEVIAESVSEAKPRPEIGSQLRSQSRPRPILDPSLAEPLEPLDGRGLKTSHYYFLTLGPFECIVSSRDASSTEEALLVAAQRTWFTRQGCETDLSAFNGVRVEQLTREQLLERQ